MQETRVQSLGQEDPLEKEMATHSSVLAWRIPWTGGAGWATIHGIAKSQTRLSDFTFTFTLHAINLKNKGKEKKENNNNNNTLLR